MKKIKVLYIVPSLNVVDGISSYAMNYYRNMKNISVDFLITSTLDETEYSKEVIDSGNKVYYIKSNEIKKIYSTCKKIDAFFKEKAHSYDIVHCHVASLGIFYLYYAKKYGIAIRIIHSHATKSADTLLHKIRNDVSSVLTINFATDYAACSIAAGEALFGNKKFEMIRNGIDVQKFSFSLETRTKYRKLLNIENKFVIGTVGRLCNQKNQNFLIGVALELKKMKQNFVIIIVGNGPLEGTLTDLIAENQLEDYIMLLGKRNDVKELYNAMDIFVLPSLFEGLPIVGIEAQCNGLKCIFSDKITREVNVSKDCSFLEIDKDNKWAQELLKYIGTERKEYDMSEYNIKNCSKKLEQYYLKMLER